LNGSKIAMTSRPLLSREYVYVAGDDVANAPTNHAVTRKYAKNEEGRLIADPRLLISWWKVRILHGPPFSRTYAALFFKGRVAR
jgi:hypothetical protein